MGEAKKNMEKTLESITNHIREQILEYALWKANQVQNLDDFKKAIQNDLQNLHHTNMEHINHEINNK